jgi:hypothetical protein
MRQKMGKKLLPVFIGIIVVAVLVVTIVPFIFGRNTGTGIHGVDGKNEGRSLTFNTVTPGETASTTTSVTPTMQSLTPTSTVGSLTPNPTPTEVLYTGKASLGTFQYGGVGVRILVYGYAFLPGEHVALYWNYQHQGQFELATPIADSSGNFTYDTTAPSDPNLGKGYIAVLFNYPIAISPTSGPAYTMVTITGSKFTPNGTIWISWSENGGAPPSLGTAIASPTGTFTVSVKVLPCPTPTCAISIWDNTAQRGAMSIPFPET